MTLKNGLSNIADTMSEEPVPATTEEEMDPMFRVSCPLAIPVSELGDQDIFCHKCQKQLEEACFDGFGRYYCEKCMETRIARVEKRAESYAASQCRITAQLPKYDRAFEFRCTPEDYEMGAKESYSPNAYLAHCRHNCTNYEILIERLDPEQIAHKVWYWAIRDRIETLLQDAIDERELLDDDEDESESWR